jgi:NAD-dependent dihydropyrimidine dehydrogenase PreA subunit
VTYVSTEPCIDVKDRCCIEECPVDCIDEGDRMLHIHLGECVDCGACEPVCLVEAIFYEDDVPAQWKEFTAANAVFFPRARSRSAPRAGRPTSAPGARRRLCRQLLRCPTARSPAHEPTWAG